MAPRLALSRSEIPVPEQQGVRRLYKSYYEDGRYYQGTTSTLAEKRQREGMDPSKKTSTSVDAAHQLGILDDHGISDFRDTALRHMYHSKLKHGNDLAMGANDYARLATTNGGEPKIVRSIIPDDVAQGINLHPDPDTGAVYLQSGKPYNPAVRHDGKLDPGFVLGSQSGPADPPQPAMPS
ncbi:hypothetical protein [Variovorax sp. 770b2]|uniref:hypothetical protein n=1 Tax=Variovorax sp. 770b2 TaxID=1566271 RepID=UPI0008EC3DF0|nr:hypothetical protein [Variovorax sp. 770b2]SFQ04051.1 hypothetical protein SAMN03159339_5258 [Variovorax sp. 770b2]